MAEVRPIDANALKQHYNVPDAEGVFSYCDTIMRVIDDQPTIEAEPVRHGRWNYRHEDDWCYCTACGTDAEESNGECLETDYCPHCGARMDDTDTNVGGKGGEQE